MAPLARAEYAKPNPVHKRLQFPLNDLSGAPSLVGIENSRLRSFIRHRIQIGAKRTPWGHRSSIGAGSFFVSVNEILAMDQNSKNIKLQYAFFLENMFLLQKNAKKTRLYLEVCLPIIQNQLLFYL